MMRKVRPSMPLLIVAIAAVIVLVGGYYAFPWLRTRLGRTARLGAWLHNPSAHTDWSVSSGDRCAGAPFILPTAGYIGFIWGDSLRPGQRHQGIDIFGGTSPGQTPVLSVYPGYLTRLPDWKSTVIIRIPSDPLSPGRQIWAYYTHMADESGSSYISPEFPPGTHEKFVEAGTFLGYQGDFSGDPYNPVGVHLHFSIVQDDGLGSFRNELMIVNTFNPSPYFGLALNAGNNPGDIVVCSPVSTHYHFLPSLQIHIVHSPQKGDRGWFFMRSPFCGHHSPLPSKDLVFIGKGG